MNSKSAAPGRARVVTRRLVSVFEPSRIDAWLKATLAGDSQLATLAPGGIFEGDIPSVSKIQSLNGGAAPYPVVVYALTAKPDTTALGGNRLMANVLATVKAVTDGRDETPAANAADRIEQLLQRGSGISGGLLVVSCVRQSGLSYAERDEATSYRHCGGLYAISITSS